jgi:hypothetical protein
LHNTHPFAQQLVLLQDKVQVAALAVLEDRAEGVVVNFKHIQQADNVRVFQRLVYVVFSARMLHIALDKAHDFERVEITPCGCCVAGTARMLRIAQILKLERIPYAAVMVASTVPWCSWPFSPQSIGC